MEAEAAAGLLYSVDLACNVTLEKLDYKFISLELQFEMHNFKGTGLHVSRN